VSQGKTRGIPSPPPSEIDRGGWGAVHKTVKRGMGGGKTEFAVGRMAPGTRRRKR